MKNIRVDSRPFVVENPSMGQHYESPGDELIEAELTAEAAGECVVYNDPAQGVAAMKARIDYLQRRIASSTTLKQDVDDAHTLAQAQARLREYQIQLDGRN